MKRERRREQKAGESQRGGEVNGLIEGSGRRGQRATHASPVCLVLQGQVYQVRSRSVDRKICCFDLTLSRLSPPFFAVASPSLLLTFPPVYLPNSLSTLPSSVGSSGTSQFSLCRLSRWPSLRSALECCFYIAASGGMWSLF